MVQWYLAYIYYAVGLYGARDRRDGNGNRIFPKQKTRTLYGFANADFLQPTANFTPRVFWTNFSYGFSPAGRYRYFYLFIRLFISYGYLYFFSHFAF